MKQWKRLFLLIAVFASYSLHAKVLIITHSYNRADFIEIQHKTFKRFLQDEYEFVVFNDARDEVIRQQIVDTCKRLGIQCVRIPQEIHKRPYLYRMPGEDKNHPSVRTSNVIQYSLNTLGFSHGDIVAIFDSDMFVIQPLSIRKYLKGYHIAAVEQARGRIHYIWNGLVFLDMPHLPQKRTLNFNCGIIKGQACDTAGYTYYYFRDHPEVRLRKMPLLHINNIKPEVDLKDVHAPIREFIEKKPDNVEFLLNFSVLHYRSGGNWDYRSQEYHQRKTRLFHEFLNKILK
jgi:hypothetical protein